MQNQNRIKLQAMTISSVLLIACLCEPMRMTHADEAYEIKPAASKVVTEKSIEVMDILEIEEEPEVKVEEASVESNVLSDYEIDLIALVTMAEAEGEPEEGKRLVIDVILNRLDSNIFPDTIDGVVYQKGQFEAMWNGRSDRCYVMEDIRRLVEEELVSRTNSKVLYFRTNHYHNFGTPELYVGNHYFSS